MLFSYYAETDSYALMPISPPGGTTTFGSADIISTTVAGRTYQTSSGQVTNTLVLGTGYETDYGYSQRYSAAARWTVATQQGDDVQYSVRSFVYGIPTPNVEIPVTGRAGYLASLLGAHTSQFETGLLNLSGAGSIIVEFGTGEILLDMITLSQRADGSGLPTIAFNSLTGTGLLTSSNRYFGGDFTFSTNEGAEIYQGTLDGEFYGPSAQAIGGTLYGSAGGDSFVSAAFSGAQIADVDVGDALDSLTGLNHFYGVGLSTNYSYKTSTGGPFPFVSYDKDTGTYVFRSFEARYYAGQGSLQLMPADREPSLDDADFEYYVTGSGADQLQIGIFGGTVDGTELTYTSFARVRGFVDNGSQPVRDYVSFGSATPVHQIPTSGSANYSGRVFGEQRDDTTILASIVGTSTMAVDFGTQALTATLNLSFDLGGPIGSYDFNGQVNNYSGGFNASGVWVTPGASNMHGLFYGDSAQEYAATFSIDDSPNDVIYDGIAIGAQD